MSNVENISNPFMSIETPFENGNNNFYEEEQKQAEKAMHEIRLGQSNNQEDNSRQQDYLDTFTHVASLAGEKQQIAEDYNGAMGAGVDTLQEYNVLKAKPVLPIYNFNKLEEQAPVTAEAYRNKFYDSVSMQDYLPELAGAEKSYNKIFKENLYYQQQEENAGYGILDSILASTYQGTNDVLRGLKSIGVSAGSKIMNSLHKTVGLVYELIDPDQAKFLESFNLQNINEEQITELGSWLANFWGDLDEKDYQDIIRTINKSLNDTYVAEDVLPEISLTENYAERLANSGTVNEFIGNVAQVLPQIAVALGAGVTTGGGAWAGGASAFLTNFGMSLDSYNKDPLANKDRKELAAFLNAAAQTPLEFIGLKGIFKAFKPKSSVGIAFKDWIMGNAVEGGTEYFQSYPELIAQEFVRGKNLDEMDDVADILNILFSWNFQKDALYQGAVGAAGGGVFGSVGAIGTLRNERAKAKNLVNITSNLEFAKKYPALFKARMEEHIEHGTVPENMFVQAVKIDGLFQGVEETGITKPELDVFLEQAGIDKADYEEALKTGGTVDLPTANIPLLLETEKGTALLQEISASNVNETTGTQEVLDDLEKSKQAANTDEKIFTPVDEYLLEQEYSASDEEIADYEARNAEIQQQAMEQEALYKNEEQDLLSNTVNEIINATKNTERPYSYTEAMNMATIIDATLENISKNSGISKVGAYKRFAPHFLSRFATQEQLDKTIQNIKTDRVSSAANVFNPHAVTNFRRSKGYKQELAELKKAPLEELNGVYAMIKAVGDKIRITKAVTEYGEQYKEARRRMPRLFSKTQGRDYDDWRDVAKYHGYTDDLDDFGHVLEMIANAPTREEIIEEQKSAYMLDEEALEEQVKINLENAEEVDPDAAYREELDFDRQEEMFFDELDEMAFQFDDKAISVLEKYYQEQEKIASPRAAFMSVAGAKGIIQFFQATDITTASHEIGHWLRFVLEESAKLPYTTGAKSEDWRTACEFVGAEYGQKWTRQQEEKFAEEFVKYLSKGKAPSNKLKRVFNNLKNLFVNIYKKIRGNVTVSKEMAEIFDRLLATEKEIKLARQKTGTVEVNNPASRYELDTFVYMNDEQKETWESLRQKANEEAEEAMHDKLMKEYQAEKKKWKGEGRKIANEDIDHKRLAMIIEKGGIYLDEETREQYKTSLANITNKWKRTIFTDKKIGSMNADQAAELFDIEGMNSTGDLIAYLESMPTKKQMIEDYVAKKSADWENSWRAEEVVLTDSVSELLGVEADSLAKAVGVSSVSGRALRKMVKDTVAAREVGSIENPVENLIQVSKENARLAKAYLKMKNKSEKNMKLALEYKEKQRISVEQIRERYAIKEMRDKALKKIKRVLKANKDKAVLDRNYFNMYHALAYKFGLTDKAPEVETLSIMEFMQNEQNNDVQFEVPEWLAALPERSKINYKKLSVDKFQDVLRVLTYLETRGRTLAEYKTAFMKADLNMLARDCVESMQENLKDKKTYDDIERQKSIIAKLSGIANKIMADFRGMPFVIEAMDGYRAGVDKINGINYKAILEPLYNAESEKITMVKDVFDKLEIILEPLKNMSKAEQTKRWAIPEVPLSEAVKREWGELAWNKQRVYMVALNMGNSGNIEALKNGYGWTDEDLKTITSYLSKEEWTMIQQIWDLVDEMSPQLSKVYEELTGMPMKKVEAEPVETPFGILQGGYFPIVYDSRLSDVAYQREIDDINRQTPSMFAGAKVKDGFTKARKGGGKLAVKLSMDVLESHLTDTIQYITHAIPVSNIRKLINHQYFKENFVRKFGNETYKAMDSWLKYIARPEKERLSGLESVAEAGRHLATIYAMGMNVTTATLAFASLPVSANEIGYKNVLVGLKYILQNRQEAYNAITKLSPYMANRPKDFQHEIKKNLQKYSPTSAPTFETSIMGKPVKIYMKDMETVAFKLMSFMDSIVAYSTWYGAYQKAMAETNGDMQRSITYADRIVDTTQSSGSNINLTEVQRKSVYTRILAMFMTFTINFENRLINKIGEAQAKDYKISAKDYILWSLNEITLPVILTILIRAILNGDDLPEEPEDYWKQIGKEHLYYLVSGIPVMRNISSVLDWNSSNLTGNSILDKQIVNLMKSPQKAYKALFEDGDMESFIKTSIDAGSFITGIPAHRVYQYFNRSYDLLQNMTK